MRIIDIIRKYKTAYLHYIRKRRFSHLKQEVTDPNISIITSNCLGGVIPHDYGVRFNSPTVNLFIPAPDYIPFLKNLKKYLQCDIVDITGDSNYPIGLLGGDIHLHFLHYSSFKEAYDIWMKRRSRVNYDNLFIVFTENDNCNYDILKEFDNLLPNEMCPFKNKVMFTHKKYNEFKCSVYVPGFEDKGRVALVTGWKGLFGARNYDIFDWSNFLFK